MKFRLAIILLSMGVCSGVNAGQGFGAVMHFSKGSTATIDTNLNDQAYLHIKVLNSTNNCANFWWVGSKRKKLGKKCGEFLLPYPVDSTSVSLRLNGLDSDSIFFIEDQRKELKGFFTSSYLTNFPMAKSIFDKCGTVIKCWKKKVK